MAAHDTLIFRDWDPVAGKPNIDGYVHDDQGVFTGETAETGYVNGSRIYLGGAGSGLQPVIAQVVKDGNSLVFGFFCRGDLSFDDSDVVVLALRPNSGSGNMEARRVDIRPVWSLTADPNDIGWGASEPDSMDQTIPDTATPDDYPTNHVRTKKHARAVQFYTQTAGSSSWSTYTPTGFTPPGPGDPIDDNGANYRIRVRSWRPSVAMGSPLEAAWSIEIRLPIDKATGGSDWINLAAGGFGLYFNIARSGRLPVSGSDYLDGWYCTQLRFPDFGSAVPPVGTNSRLTGNLDTSTLIDPAWYGTALINPPASAGAGVRFKNGVWGVGRRAHGDTATAPGGAIAVNQTNDMVAILENTGPAVNGIEAVFRIGKYGLGSWGDFKIPTGMATNATDANLAGGTPATPSPEKTSVRVFDVPAADKSDYLANSHRCMVVELTSTNPVTFTQSSIRRNMDFATLSDVETTAEVSGRGYPTPSSGDHDFLLFTRCRAISVQRLVSWYREHPGFDPETIAMVAGALQHAADKTDDVPGAVVVNHDHLRTATVDYSNVVVYAWITEGYRRTDTHLQVDDKKMVVLDETPGAFGLAAYHVGEQDRLSWSFDAPGLSNHGKGIHALKVPDGGAVTLNIRLSASPDGPAGDVSKDPPASGDHGGGPSTGGGDLPDGCLAFLTTLFKKS
jgi:hypothetical protein